MIVRALTEADVRISIKPSSRSSEPWTDMRGRICLGFMLSSFATVRFEIWVLPADWEKKRAEIIAEGCEGLRARLNAVLKKLEPVIDLNGSRPNPHPALEFIPLLGATESLAMKVVSEISASTRTQLAQGGFKLSIQKEIAQ